MGKKKKAQRNKRRKQQKGKVKPFDYTESVWVWTDDAGVRVLLREAEPLKDFLALLSERFQHELRHSPLWDEMVREFGEEEAERLLKECRVESGKKL